MNGFVRTASTHLGGTTSWSVVKTGDFNSDGKSDILWRRPSDGAVVMWLMDEAAHTSVNLGGSSDWVIVP